MKIILLGTAAGGGFPQWNCWCPTCRVARLDPRRARARTQSSIAVSVDGDRWVLINASPDVRAQVAHIPRPTPPGTAVRDVPIEGVALTDAELDHTLGLLVLREARALTLYATQGAATVLERDSRILPTIRAFATVTVNIMPLDAAVPVRDRAGDDLGLTIEPFPVPGDAPRFVAGPIANSTVGLTLRARDGATVAYIPGCGEITDALVARLRRADAVLLDGTFWSDTELVALGISAHRSRDMGHVPISGAGGSLSMLADLDGIHRIYTHINNTNPILIEDSPERSAVEAAGVFVGHDGMVLEV